MSILKMKLLGILSLMTLAFNVAVGQTTTLAIEYSEMAELTINEEQINAKTSVKRMIKNLGEPSKVVDYPSKEKSYFYEELGIVFFTMGGSVKGLGVNFNWDGDKKFPEKAFEGSLKIGASEVTQETNKEFIEAIEEVKFICPFSMMCASQDREAKINCTIGFMNEKISQIAFVIK